MKKLKCSLLKTDDKTRMSLSLVLDNSIVEAWLLRIEKEIEEEVKAEKGKTVIICLYGNHLHRKVKKIK